MPNYPVTGDPLLRAIAELRVEMNRMIDEQVARRGDVEAIPRAASPGDWTTGPVLAPPRPDPKPRRGPVSAPFPLPVAVPVAPVAAGDPKQRLDALARHLDGRRRAGERAAADTGEDQAPNPTAELENRDRDEQ